MMNTNLDIYDVTIGDKFMLMGKIGSGAYGTIHLGVDTSNLEERVAVKVERLDVKSPLLSTEKEMYTILQGSPGIPKVRWYGQVREYNVLVMDLLGPSLEYLFNYCSRRFCTSTIAMIAEQMISRIEYIHSKGLIHGDIKPQNILIGSGASDGILFLIDFGLAKLYHDPVSGCHIPFEENKPFIGTPAYSSINTDLGIERSRRDDLESLGYTLIYFIKGKLPWQTKALNKKQRCDRMKEMKMSISIEDLCKDMPLQIPLLSFFQYCRNLKFADSPNYEYLQNLFVSQFCHPLNYPFDWITLRCKFPRSHSGEAGTIALGPYGYPAIDLYN